EAGDGFDDLVGALTVGEGEDVTGFDYTSGQAVQHAAASGFIDDSKASLDLRNFYYNQDTRNARGASDKEHRLSDLGLLAVVRCQATQQGLGAEFLVQRPDPTKRRRAC
ncbi:OprD family outer membrane porin, partial [Klebsiella variicola]|uniref:OprD family outer membrane porin n=1 Tax=Klebsiella variicola TaxID=244366 RepID=UPI0027312B0D